MKRQTTQWPNEKRQQKNNKKNQQLRMYKTLQRKLEV
jgi:hypothetical protein